MTDTGIGQQRRGLTVWCSQAWLSPPETLSTQLVTQEHGASPNPPACGFLDMAHTVQAHTETDARLQEAQLTGIDFVLWELYTFFTLLTLCFPVSNKCSFFSFCGV